MGTSFFRKPYADPRLHELKVFLKLGRIKTIFLKARHCVLDHLNGCVGAKFSALRIKRGDMRIKRNRKLVCASTAKLPALIKANFSHVIAE